MTFLTCDGEEGTSVPPWKKSRTYHMLKNRNTWQIPDNILTCRSISVVTIQQSPVSWPSLVPAFIRQGCSNTSSSLAPQLRRPGWVCLRRTSNALSITPPPHFPILLHNNRCTGDPDSIETSIANRESPRPASWCVGGFIL